MTALQFAAVLLVAIAGTATVLTPDPLRQTFVLGIFGFTLTFLFFTFQAPDVALSEIVVVLAVLPSDFVTVEPPRLPSDVIRPARRPWICTRPSSYRCGS